MTPETQKKWIHFAQSNWNLMKWFWLVWAAALVEAVIRWEMYYFAIAISGLALWLIIAIGSHWLAKNYPNDFKE